jgi:hypothetical protein
VTVFSSEDNYRDAVVGPGGGNVWEIYFNSKRAKVGWVWVKPIAAIAQIVSGMRALVWTELATDHSKQARLILAFVNHAHKKERIWPPSA